MLSKILEEMWVEPEVLEALSEEQKRILFLKMREEQVRRWREREEREEREEGDDNNNRPKKADNKHVRWLLGRDGDVSVSVIGEVDEFRSSKLLQSLMSSRVHADNMNAIQTSDLPTGRDCIQLSLTDVNDDPAPPRHQWSEEESCSTDDDPKDLADADSDSESGGSSVNWAPLNRPHLSSHGNRPPLKAQLSDAGRAGRQNKEPSEHGGRVARLRKAFSEDRQLPPAYNKPTIPAKPAHLQKRSAPLIR